MTVGITRHEPGAGDLRREARRCRDGAASRRFRFLSHSTDVSYQRPRLVTVRPVAPRAARGR